MSNLPYQPEKGLEDYLAVSVTQRQGKDLPAPVTEHYHPSAWPAVRALAGFKATVLYDPRTDAQKQAEAPAAGTVKATSKPETPEQYRDRYKELFREEAPFNMSADTLKVTVDRAESRLFEATGEAPAAPEADDADVDKLPTNKTEWFALFQKTFPEDATQYDDITEKAIREKLGK